jgi:hypothetical protein
MAFKSTSKSRKVVDYLASGRTLTAAQAAARFGVANLRATISDIKSVVEAYGNHEITTEETATGKTAYGMRSFN